MAGPSMSSAFRNLLVPRRLLAKGCTEGAQRSQREPLPDDYHVALGLVIPFLSQRDQ